MKSLAETVSNRSIPLVDDYTLSTEAWAFLFYHKSSRDCFVCSLQLTPVKVKQVFTS